MCPLRCWDGMSRSLDKWWHNARGNRHSAGWWEALNWSWRWSFDCLTKILSANSPRNHRLTPHNTSHQYGGLFLTNLECQLLYPVYPVSTWLAVMQSGLVANHPPWGQQVERGNVQNISWVSCLTWGCSSNDSRFFPGAYHVIWGGWFCIKRRIWEGRCRKTNFATLMMNAACDNVASASACISACTRTITELKYSL